MTDIQAKYQKLATEFAKVRSQVPVLKKAVLDEQAKGDLLKEEIKSKEQSLRKYEQEVDSLKFRNQQLSSRVEILQKDLEDVQLKPKKNKKNAVPLPVNSSSVNTVIGEELQSKIKENAELHNRLFEIENRHREEIDNLQRKVEILERDAGSQRSVLDDNVNMYTQQIDKLKETEVMLQIRLHKRDAEKQEADEKVKLLNEKLHSIENDLSTKLGRSNRIITEKIPFNDSSEESLNSLNIPVYDRHQQVHCRELFTQMSVLVCDLVQGLSNWYTYTEQRIKIYPLDSAKEPITEVSKKMSEYLHQNTTSLRPVDQCFKQLLESFQEDSVISLDTAIGLQEFSCTFKQMIAYISKLLPYQLLNLDEESSVSVCPHSLQTRNQELKTSYKALEAAFSKIETYISALAAHSKNVSKDTLHYSSQPKLLLLLSKSITDITICFQDIAKLYRAKVSLEHELPTFTDKLKVTNECIMPALLSLVNVSNKIDKFFTSNMEFMCSQNKKTDSYTHVKVHPNTTEYRMRSANYITSLNRPCPDSVPHSTAVHNRRTLYSSTESRDSLAQQVVSLQEKCNKSEQGKEHWMLESKLLQMKYEKECLKAQELEKKIKGPNNLASRNTNLVSSKDVAAPGSPVIAPGGPPLTSMPSIIHIASSFRIPRPLPVAKPVKGPTKKLGRLERSVSEEKDIEARENFIKKYYTEKIYQLTEQLQIGDSKGLHFHAECRALHKRINIVQCDKDKLQNDMESSNQNVSQLKDELQTTTNSYEGQLSMLSEHLAAMNEKITTQKDEIDSLKYQMHTNTKSTKRSFLGKK